MMPLLRLVFIGSLLIQGVWGKELFTLEKLQGYLTLDNPFMYSALGSQYIDAARIQTAQGGFDTTLATNYDKKEYPLSRNEFTDITLSKPTQSGTEFILGYRNASGTHEFHNIKTGQEGEFRAGVKVPIVALMHQTNERKYRLDNTKLQATQSRFDAQNQLRTLQARIIIAYYELLYAHELVGLETQLLEKAKTRNQFIAQRVSSGDLAQLALIEAKQHIINRTQRLNEAQNSYMGALQRLVQYLNTDTQTFQEAYTLPALCMLKESHTPVDDLIDQALEHRPDLKVLNYQGEKLTLEGRFNALWRYPTLNLFAYGVHDVQQGDGFKVGFEFTLPIERNRFEGKTVEIQKGLQLLQEQKNKLILELKTALRTFLFALETVGKNINLSEEEIVLTQTLEEAENRRYQTGLSDLFQVNLREIAALEVKRKQLSYRLQQLVIQREMKKEMGEFLTIKPPQ